jgi:bacterial/archaeal transporter family-2 protein
MTNPLLFILFGLAAGFVLPLQAGINSQLTLWTESPVLSATISFFVGTACLVLYSLVVQIPWPSLSTLGRHPWWIWIGGVFGAIFVVATVVLAIRLGAAPMVALVVAGQLFASVLLDHYGLMGYEPHPVNVWRLVGVIFLAIGVVLIKRF